MSSLLMTAFAPSPAFDGLFNTASCANAACIPATNTATTTANRHIVILLRLRCHPRQGPLDRPGRRLHEHPPVPVAHPRQQEVAPKPRRHDRGLPPGQPKWEQTSAQAHERQEALPPRAGLPVAHRVGEHHQHHAQREPPPREHTEQDDPDEGGRDEPPPRLARPDAAPAEPPARRAQQGAEKDAPFHHSPHSAHRQPQMKTVEMSHVPPTPRVIRSLARASVQAITPPRTSYGTSLAAGSYPRPPPRVRTGRTRPIANSTRHRLSGSIPSGENKVDTFLIDSAPRSSQPPLEGQPHHGHINDAQRPSEQ